MASLEVVLLPCNGGDWIVLPQSIIGRVYPYAPSFSVENASEFVIGSMIVQNEKMPVIDFHFSDSETDYDGAYRMLLVSAITNKTTYHRYAVISYGDPEMLTVEESNITQIGESNHRYIAQYVSIVGQENKRIILLDIPLFEAELTMR